MAVMRYFCPLFEQINRSKPNSLSQDYTNIAANDLVLQVLINSLLNVTHYNK